MGGVGRIIRWNPCTVREAPPNNESMREREREKKNMFVVFLANFIVNRVQLVVQVVQLWQLKSNRPAYQKCDEAAPVRIRRKLESKHVACYCWGQLGESINIQLLAMF